MVMDSCQNFPLSFFFFITNRKCMFFCITVDISYKRSSKKKRGYIPVTSNPFINQNGKSKQAVFTESEKGGQQTWLHSRYYSRHVQSLKAVTLKKKKKMQRSDMHVAAVRHPPRYCATVLGTPHGHCTLMHK